MNRFTALVRKELRSYFNSPVAYAAVVFYLVFTSVWFFYIQRFAAQNVASMRGYFQIVPIVFIVLLPALTMRSWAEEHKMGTAEILTTLPFSETELVLGKFAASFLILLVMMVLSMPVPISIARLGHFESGQIIGEYLGMVLLGSTGISLGLFVSSLSKNQISAFLFSACILLLFTLIGQAAVVLDLSGSLSSVVYAISFDQHFESFRKGVIDTRDIAYFAVLTVFFLLANSRMLKIRKW